MIRIVAKSVVQSFQKEAYLRLAKELIEESRKEPGCISYELYQEIGNANVLTFIEEWENQASVDSHNQSKHFKSILPRMAEYRVGPSEVTYYRVADYK